MRKFINRTNRGFTLIELLVVIAIIGILAAVVLVSLNSARSKSRDARRLADIRQVMTALELYYNDGGGYPPTVTSGGAITCGTNPSYMATVPTNPTPGGTTYTYAATGSTSATTCPGGAGNVNSTYTLTFTLEGTAGGFSSGIHTASQAGLQ